MGYSLMRGMGAIIAGVGILLGGCSSSTGINSEKARLISENALQFYHEGEATRARELLLEKEIDDSLSPADLLLMGRISLLNDEIMKAQEYLERAISHVPHYIDGRKWLARVHLAQGEDEKALEILKPSLEISGEDAELLLLQARALRELGDIENAIHALLKSKALGNRLAETALELAMIYRAFGSYKNAQSEIEFALHLLPSDSRLRGLLEQMAVSMEHDR